MNKTIKLTQCGQLRPYADSIYAGTVQADTEQQARNDLQEMRGSNMPIYGKQDKKNWHYPYFEEFREIEPGLWRFRIVEEYTG